MFHPFIEGMLARKSGTLVGVASVAGIRGLPGHGAYCSEGPLPSAIAQLAWRIARFGCEGGHPCCQGMWIPRSPVAPLPHAFLLQPGEFARRAAQAIARQSSYSVIPWQMGLVAKLLRVLPNAWFDKVFAGRPRKRRQGE